MPSPLDSVATNPAAAPTRSQVFAMYRAMLRIRRFEQELHRLVGTGAIGGTTHLCAGQEAIAVGVSSLLSVHDQVVSTHRGHGHLLAKGAACDRALAEFAGRAAGYCMGKGGSQHTAVPAIGHMGSNGITGGGLPIAAGLALAQQLRCTGNVVVAYLGDGAATTGNFHETLNLAALWRLPVVFVLEHNGFAMSTPTATHSACAHYTDWAERYRGVATASVDGNDVLAVASAAAPLLQRARRGEGPAFLECATWRHFGHSKSDPCVYRSKHDDARWRQHDPLAVLQRRTGLTEAEIVPLAASVDAEIAAAVQFAMQSPAGDRALALAHMDVPPVSAEPAPCRLTAGHEVSVTEALRETLRGEMERDERVLLLGEDLGVYGGAFGVSRGLLEQFGPQRVRETPISENGFTGLAVGAAVGGLRPVVELMFSDFVTCCMDALVNHAAKLRYMYAGQVTVPLTMRLPIGRRHGYGATHSQSLEAWFLHVPGLQVVCPATVPDAVGLLRTAMRCDAPVLFLEPKLLYPARGPMPAPDHVVPLGSARIERDGGHVTLFTYGQCVPICRAAADLLAAEGIDAGIVDLRSLAPFDLDTCTEVLRKTGRGLVVHEGSTIGGVGDALIGALLPRAFGWLHAPLGKVAAEHVPMPSSPQLEEFVMPGAAAVADRARALARDW
ncbi:MAG TPA: dehydrogenase E1 component subunit alpha/beta [Planctomycetota bacterium]|nr:dehydrogenase E1 component subunit alpha/beta [Planctomycetota bacterium]